MEKLQQFLKDSLISHFSEMSLLEERKIHKFKCGVYGIYCKTDDKIYLGSAVNFYTGLADHFKMCKNENSFPKQRVFF